MRCVGFKTIKEAFPDLRDPEITLIRKLARVCGDREELRDIITCLPKTRAYAAACYSDPFDSYMWRVTLTLHAINDIMGTHGVEPLGTVMMKGPPYEYLNTGDTYAATLIYDREKDRLFIGSWGDIAETMKDDDGNDE